VKSFRTGLFAVSMLVVFVLSPQVLMQRMQPAVPAYLAGMGGDFTLLSAGGPVSLHDFRGKVGLLYFGYTHCPDACPMALASMARAMRGLPPDLEARVYGLFVSVDPRRDTPRHLHDFTAFFDRRIVGITGSPAQLAALASKYRMDFQVPDAPADASYAVAHSRFIYLIDAMGRVVQLFDEKTPSERMRRAMQRWLQAARWQPLPVKGQGAKP